MATTGRTAAADSDEAALATTLHEADFVHFVSHADGDAIAAAGLLANALPTDTAFQVSIARTQAAADRRIDAASGTTVTIGLSADHPDASLDDDSNALVAFDVANERGTADPVLALAGAIATNVVPRGAALDAATEAGVDRRPGVGIPTADLGDGLAHSTFLHAGVSGDEQQAGALLAELELPATMDERAHRRVASAVALEVTAPPAPERAAEALERVLKPHVLTDRPFETIEGYADVLDGLARSDPGLASTLAIGHENRTAALDAWRDHARAVHDAVRLGERTRRSGLVLLETDRADPWTTARLVRDFRSAEPAVLVVGAADVALATTDSDALARLESIAAIESVGGRSRLASATTDAEAEEIVAALEADR
jgi:hypothetical protein